MIWVIVLCALAVLAWSLTMYWLGVIAGREHERHRRDLEVAALAMDPEFTHVRRSAETAECQARVVLFLKPDRISSGRRTRRPGDPLGAA